MSVVLNSDFFDLFMIMIMNYILNKDAISVMSQLITSFKYRCNRLLFTNVSGHGRHWHNQFCIKSSIKHSLKFSSCWNDTKCHVSTDCWFDLESTGVFFCTFYHYVIQSLDYKKAEIDFKQQSKIFKNLSILHMVTVYVQFCRVSQKWML